MELVRYKPGEAIRWLEMGAEDFRKSAQRKSKSLVRREGERTIGQDVRDVAGALVGIGKGAIAELLHKQADASEYVLHDDHIEIITPTRIRSIRYSAVQAIRMRGERASVVLDQGSITIKPHAHIVSGKLRVPVGWTRNGMEVPYEVLLDELSARCDVRIEQAA